MTDPSPTGAGLTVFGSSALAIRVAAQRGAVALREPDAGASGAVFLDLATDVETVTALQALLADGARPDREIVAHVRDAGLRRTVNQNLDRSSHPVRPILFGSADVAAARLADVARLHEVAYWRGQPRVHVVLVGFGPLGRACFGALVVAGIAGTLGRPRITILVQDETATLALMARICPEIADSADFVVLPVGAGPLPLAAAAAESPLTAIVVADEDAATALSLARAIREDQDRSGRPRAALYLVSENPMPPLAIPAGQDRDLGRRITAVHAFEDSDDIVADITSRRDALARRLHEAYAAKFGGGAGSVPWDRLPETYRDANRSAARHLDVKLWSAGLRDRRSGRDAAAVQPVAMAAVATTLAAATSEDATLRTLARLEHERWCAERRLDGWRYGVLRDDLARRHPDLVAFDDPRFETAQIVKDEEQVRFLFGSVVTASPEGRNAPIVLGITADPQIVGLVTPEAALALCARDPWRSVIVVCALLDAAEVAAARALIRALGAMPWRLIVPELAGARRVVPDRDLADLLQHGATEVAPIDAPGPEPAAWVEPDAAADRGALLRSYLVARSTALVRCGEDGSTAGSPA